MRDTGGKVLEKLPESVGHARINQRAEFSVRRGLSWAEVLKRTQMRWRRRPLAA